MQARQCPAPRLQSNKSLKRAYANWPRYARQFIIAARGQLSLSALFRRYVAQEACMPICAECGHEHPHENLELTFRRPDAVVELSAEERDARVQENNDLCVLDGRRFFIRALLPLPVADRELPYNVGLWAEVSQKSFERVYELWNDGDQSDEPAFEATVANEIRIHPSTCGLSASLSLTGPSTRPVITLCQAEHPLFSEQSRGISAHRAAEYSSLCLHGAA